jgi:hypothetical protein
VCHALFYDKIKITSQEKKTMGNETSLENWASRERLRMVEVFLWWRGWVGRGDLGEVFGISSAQASSDLQRYQELNPGAMGYQTSRKRYESSARMKCVLHEPRLPEGLSLLEEGVGGMVPQSQRLIDGKAGSGRVAVVSLPKRGSQAAVERRLLLAAMGRRPVKVTYLSLSEGEVKPRVIVPHAFGWDGRRWHTRAWDQGHEDWRDYVLGRFDKASWPQEEAVEDLPKDEDWERLETIHLQVNPKLSEKAKAGIRLDYGLKDDVLKLKVRTAMKPYLLAELFIEEGKAKELPRHFRLISK